MASTVCDRAGAGKAELDGNCLLLRREPLARWVTLLLAQSVPKANITHAIDECVLAETVAIPRVVCLPGLRSSARTTRLGTGTGDS